MSSCSQNLPRTFFKLSTTWNKKAGTRNFNDNIFGNTTTKQEPIYHIAAMMNTKFNDHSQDIIGAFQATNYTQVKYADSAIWIYNMRKSDSLPKANGDMEKLYAFVRHLINCWFERDEQWYLDKHIHIAVCFFVWYFTTPNYFFKDKEIRQTTRQGVQRVWKPVLLEKAPIIHVTNSTLTKKTTKITKTTDILLPKQQKEQAEMRKKIEELIHSEHPSCKLEWNDQRSMHLKISDTMAYGSEFFIGGKKAKKLQKIYNDYTNLTAKINKTLEKIHKVERANAKIAVSAAEEVTMWDDKLGPPPDSLPVLTRKQAECVFESETCYGCATNQPNQLAHVGGCMPDVDDTEIEAEEVPESWEDL